MSGTAQTGPGAGDRRGSGGRFGGPRRSRSRSSEPRCDERRRPRPWRVAARAVGAAVARRASFVLVLTLAVGVLRPALAQRSDVARELAIRDGARDLATAAASIAADDAPWTERAASLAALERALAVAPTPPPSRAPAAVLRALSDPHPNVRAAALGVLAREPRWAVAALGPGDLTAAAGGLLEEPLLRALQAALAAVHGGADPAPFAPPALAVAEDAGARDRVRRAALGLALQALGTPSVADRLAALLRARWDLDEVARDAVAAAEWLDLGPATLAGLAARLDGEPGAVFAALAAGRGAALDVERVLDHWPDALSDAARFESLRLAALVAADAATVDRWVARAAAVGDDQALKAVVRAVGPDPLLRALPTAAPEVAEALLDGLSGTDVLWSLDQARAATARTDLPGATVDALAAAALLDDRAVVQALAERLPELDREWAERVARLLGPDQVTRHVERVAAAWERFGRPVEWVDLFVDDGPAPPLRAGLLALARAEEAGGGPPDDALVLALARFEGDREVAALFRGWFGAALERRPARGGPLDGAALDSVALGTLAGPAARVVGEPLVPALELALAGARGEAGPARALVGALARTGAGRRVLAVELDAAGWNPTARDAARVALLEAGALPSGHRGPLLAALGELPSELEERALDGLVAHPDPSAVEALFERVRPGSDVGLALRCLEALGRIGGPAVVERLEAGYRAEPDYDLRRGHGAALAAAGAVDALERLLGVLHAGRFEAGGPVPGTWPDDFVAPSVDAGRRRLADELGIALARLGRPVVDPDRGVLGTLAERAAETLARRFDRRPVEGSELALYVELPTLVALRGDPRLADALARSGPWWRGDGRWLAACAEALGTADAVGRSLAAAADVALAGERGLERGRRGRTQALILDLALEAGDWPAVARAVGRTLLELESGELARGDLYRAYDAPWPAAGSHPANQLRALRHVADARLRLAAGDLPGARAAAARARAIPAAEALVATHLVDPALDDPGADESDAGRPDRGEPAPAGGG